MSGDLPAAEYDWNIPGDNGQDPGPVFEHNQEKEEKTVWEGEWLHNEEAKSDIELTVSDPVPIPPNLDEAHAEDETEELRCGPDVDGLGSPGDLVPDPRELIPDPRDLQEQSSNTTADAQQTLCHLATLPFCK